jgi:hypothetical protein
MDQESTLSKWIIGTMFVAFLVALCLLPDLI